MLKKPKKPLKKPTNPDINTLPRFQIVLYLLSIRSFQIVKLFTSKVSNSKIIHFKSFTSIIY